MRLKFQLYFKCKCHSRKEFDVSEKDRVSKWFFRDNERYADLLNGLIYDGNQVVKADDLEEVNVELNERIKTQISEERRRDLLKQCKKNGVVYALYGAEMQSTVDETMPLRVMNYDALTYLKMMKSKMQMVPIITVCLYTGEQEWNKPVSLHEMMNVPDGMRSIVQDYKVLVASALSLDTGKYRNESVRELFELMQDVHTLRKEEMAEKYGRRVCQSADAVDTAAVLTGCPELRKMIVTDQEGNRMCRNFDQMVREWKEEGKLEGKSEGITEGKKQGIQQEKEKVIQRLNKIGLPIEQIAVAVALSTSEVQSLIAG